MAPSLASGHLLFCHYKASTRISPCARAHVVSMLWYAHRSTRIFLRTHCLRTMTRKPTMTTMPIPRFSAFFLESSRKPSSSLFFLPHLSSRFLPSISGSKHVSCVTDVLLRRRAFGFKRVVTMILERQFFLRAPALSCSALGLRTFSCLPTSRFFFFFYGRPFSFSFSLCVSRTLRTLVPIYTCSTGPPKVSVFHKTRIPLFTS